MGVGVGGTSGVRRVEMHCPDQLDQDFGTGSSLLNVEKIGWPGQGGGGGMGGRYECTIVQEDEEPLI